MFPKLVKELTTVEKVEESHVLKLLLDVAFVMLAMDDEAIVAFEIPEEALAWRAKCGWLWASSSSNQRFDGVQLDVTRTF